MPYYVYSVSTLKTAANKTIVLVPTQRVAESLADRGTVQDLHRRLDDGWEVGPMIISYSELHPDDPRVPEALHLVVRATRYPRWNQGSTGEVSRAAFRVLHRRYPGSPWTEKTPYWFGS